MISICKKHIICKIFGNMILLLPGTEMILHRAKSSCHNTPVYLYLYILHTLYCLFLLALPRYNQEEMKVCFDYKRGKY